MLLFISIAWQRLPRLLLVACGLLLAPLVSAETSVDPTLSKHHALPIDAPLPGDTPTFAEPLRKPKKATKVRRTRHQRLSASTLKKSKHMPRATVKPKSKPKRPPTKK